MNDAMIRLEDIIVRFGDFEALHNINVEVKKGEFFTFLGPSGCGKTTTLRTITGFIEPVRGSVSMEGKDITKVPIEKRNIGIVFQSYALFPTMTVYNNIAFGLKIKHLKKDEIDRKVREIAKKVDLTDEQLQKAVSQLSGGQQQRVAIARALVTEPAIICLDEPLSNLDAKLRVQLRTELKNMQKDFGITSIYVTHDQVEALTMSTKIALFKEGEISQIDTPLGIYTNPIDLQAADFIGNPRINFIEAKALFDGETLRVRSEFGEFVYPKETVKQDEDIPQNSEFECVLGIRPEMLDIYTEDPHHKDTVEAKVYANQPAGSETLVSLVVGKAEFLAIQVGLIEYDMNQKVYVVLHPGRMNVYNKETGRLIKFAKTKHKAGADE